MLPEERANSLKNLRLKGQGIENLADGVVVVVFGLIEIVGDKDTEVEFVFQDQMGQGASFQVKDRLGSRTRVVML